MGRRDNASFNYFEFRNLQLFGIDMLFTDLRNYQNLIESFLVAEKSKLEEEYNETDLELESKKAGDHHREYLNHLIDSYSERHYEIAGLFPHHFRCFFITQAIAVVEAEFKKLCDYYGQYKGQKFFVDDMKGSSDLEKCKNYITNIAHIDFRNFSIEWQFIKQCKEIRNKIVHQEGLIKVNNESLLKFIETHPSLSSRKDVARDRVKFTIINNTLAIDLLKNAESFFQKFVDKLAETDIDSDNREFLKLHKYKAWEVKSNEDYEWNDVARDDHGYVIMSDGSRYDAPEDESLFREERTRWNELKIKTE